MKCPFSSLPSTNSKQSDVPIGHGAPFGLSRSSPSGSGHQHDRLAAIIATTVDGLIVIDEGGLVESFNPACERLFGYSPAEVIGNNVSMLMPSPYRQEHDGYLHSYRTTGTRKIIGIGREVTALRKNGSTFPIELSVGEAFHEGKRIFVGVIHDISERKAAESRFRDFAESASDWFWEMGSDLRFNFVSDSVREKLGVDPAIFLGKTLWEVAGGQDSWGALGLRHQEIVLHRPFHDMLYDQTNGAGEKRSIRLSGKPVLDQDGRFTGYRGVGRDVSAEMLNTRALEEAKRAAVAANRAKSEFLANMSHELRTPLNAIIGFSELLRIDPNSVLTARQDNYVGNVLQAAHHLLTLVAEVLDLSAVEAGQLKVAIRPISVSKILAYVEQTLSTMAKRAGIICTFVSPREDLAVLADKLRLRQVLINLVSNAIKYNIAGGAVSVTARRQGAVVRFSVADTGLGIAEHQQQNLFKPFQRLNAEHSTIEGTGIGLSLSRRMVEVMGGQIGFMSEAGKGSTFWIELPIASDLPTNADQRAITARLPVDDGQFSLLYVEDNLANMQLVEHIVATRPNIKMFGAATPTAGLLLAGSERPDIVLLDLSLPEMNGFELLARIKQMPETENAPVLALTAAAFPEDRERGLKAGFHEYLTKPLNVADFLKTLDETLELVRLRRAGLSSSADRAVSS